MARAEVERLAGTFETLVARPRRCCTRGGLESRRWTPPERRLSWARVTGWPRIRRALALRYPFMPSRARVPLLQGGTDDIPAGLVVDTRAGVHVKVRRDWMYRDVYYWGDYEPYNTKIYRRIVASGHTVLDVGANFGWFTTLFAKWVGDGGRVHAFEPVPFINAYAAETLALNGVESRVQLNQVALGRAPGTLTLRTFAGLPHGHATAADLGRDDAVEHHCEVTTLDRYCADNEIEAVHFMKVDVEGLEPDVFAGGVELLGSAGAPVIAFEINGECLGARSLRSDDVMQELRASGYTEFFTFSTRTGVRRLPSGIVERAECIAAKTTHLPRIEHALKTGRLIR